MFILLFGNRASFAGARFSSDYTREEAVERIKPYADAFNAKSKEIAKKYHQKPGRFSLAAYLR